MEEIVVNNVKALREEGKETLSLITVSPFTMIIIFILLFVWNFLTGELEVANLKCLIH